MKVAGSCTVAAPRERVWEALHDPSVLAVTLPGVQRLEVTGPDQYAATLTAGVASVKGTYSGAVQLLDKNEPESYRLRAEGSGAPGTIMADAVVRLEVDGESTTVHYEADAVVGGMIGGVGQRMLAGVATKTAREFFGAVEQSLNGQLPAPGGAPEEAAPSAAGAPGPSAPAIGQVFEGRPAPARPEGARIDLLVAAVVGAAIALIGVLIGRRTARR